MEPPKGEDRGSVRSFVGEALVYPPDLIPRRRLRGQSGWLQVDKEEIPLASIALLDRRLGRRRFESLELMPGEHPLLVLRMYQLRAEAEGWQAIDAGAAQPADAADRKERGTPRARPPS